ncbi:MAG: sugar phosphate isomerase/epimerase [Hyphomicrobiaceae bacterium]|nr:sugar phosphate isomerase/epimerase [Hyphomicrobiaceae bacterium]
MPITVSLITDEVAPELDAALRLAAEEGLTTVDVRSIGGVNVLSLDVAAQRAAARQIRDAGLTVGTLATPLLKWPAPGRSTADMGDQFGFDAGGRSHDQLYEDAFRCAEILGARNLRVFSLLKHDGFELAELDGDYEKLIRLAERHDATLHVENEHVCNFHSVADLVSAMHRWRHPRLRALLDIPNAWRRARPGEADIEAVTPFVEQLHFKDWSEAKGRMVALGEGDIPFRLLLEPIYGAARSRPITFVVETHVPTEPAAATRRSVRALKGLAAV